MANIWLPLAFNASGHFHFAWRAQKAFINETFFKFLERYGTVGGDGHSSLIQSSVPAVVYKRF
jgi:hypothetical protein